MNPVDNSFSFVSQLNPFATPPQPDQGFMQLTLWHNAQRRRLELLT